MRLTIARKLSIAFGVILALMAAVALVGVVSLNRASAAAEEITESQVVMQGLDRSLEYLLWERVELGRVWTRGETEHMARAEEIRAEFDAAWQVVQTHRGEEYPIMIDGVEREHELYVSLLGEAVALFEANPNDLAAVLAKVGEADDFFHRTLEPSTQLLREEEQARVQQTQASLRASVNRMVAVAATVGVIALIAGATAAYAISRGISRATSQLTLAADSISRGDLDIPIELKTGDEMETLAESIERMRISLKAAIERMRRRQAVT